MQTKPDRLLDLITVPEIYISLIRIFVELCSWLFQCMKLLHLELMLSEMITLENYCQVLQKHFPRILSSHNKVE